MIKINPQRMRRNIGKNTYGTSPQRKQLLASFARDDDKLQNSLKQTNVKETF